MMCRPEDEARMDRFQDDPRDDPDLDPLGVLELKGTCADCGIRRMKPDGPCGLGDATSCPIRAWLESADE
jgi:hypothetical protein